MTRQPGTYILWLALAEKSLIEVGRLGRIALAPGCYAYVGSALGGLASRLARHQRAAKRIHWHIDYLLQRAALREIWYHLGPERLECAWSQALARMADISPSAHGFGASDCSCATHLFFCQEPLALGAFQAQLAALGIPGDVRLGALGMERAV